jgi:hypothetical protein
MPANNNSEWLLIGLRFVLGGGQYATLPFKQIAASWTCNLHSSKFIVLKCTILWDLYIYKSQNTNEDSSTLLVIY